MATQHPGVFAYRVGRDVPGQHNLAARRTSRGPRRSQKLPRRPCVGAPQVTGRPPACLHGFRGRRAEQRSKGRTPREVTELADRHQAGRQNRWKLEAVRGSGGGHGAEVRTCMRCGNAGFILRLSSDTSGENARRDTATRGKTWAAQDIQASGASYWSPSFFSMPMSHYRRETRSLRASLMVWWSRLCLLVRGAVGLIPGGGTKIPYERGNIETRVWKHHPIFS